MPHHLTLATTPTPRVGMTILFLFGAHNSIWRTKLVAGAALGAVIGGRFGVTGSSWFAFGGSVLTLALIWREWPHMPTLASED